MRPSVFFCGKLAQVTLVLCGRMRKLPAIACSVGVNKLVNSKLRP